MADIKIYGALTCASGDRLTNAKEIRDDAMKDFVGTTTSPTQAEINQKITEQIGTVKTNYYVLYDTDVYTDSSYQTKNIAVLTELTNAVVGTVDTTGTLLGRVIIYVQEGDNRYYTFTNAKMYSDSITASCLIKDTYTGQIKIIEMRMSVTQGCHITESNLDTTLFLVVSALPTTDISTSKIYLVPGENTETNNIYTEYIYANSKWEKVGEVHAEVDLSAYAKTATVNAALAKKVDKVTGKGLSTNDFTNAYMQEVDVLNAQPKIYSVWSTSKSHDEDNSQVLQEAKIGSIIVDIDAGYMGVVTSTDNANQLCFEGAVAGDDTDGLTNSFECTVDNQGNVEYTYFSSYPTYSNATSKAAGLMSSADKTKLDKLGIYQITNNNVTNDNAAFQEAVWNNLNGIVGNVILNIDNKNYRGTVVSYEACGSTTSHCIAIVSNGGTSTTAGTKYLVEFDVDNNGTTTILEKKLLGDATTSEAGFMSAEDKTKLDTLYSNVGSVKFKVLTQDAYEALTSKDSNTVYLVKGV